MIGPGRATPVLVLLLLVAFGAACATDDPLVHGSEVGIVAHGCFRLTEAMGTGVMVGDALFATSAHTVAGADDLAVVVDGHRHRATVVAFDKDADVAIVRAEVPDGLRRPAALGEIAAGERATLVIWHPHRGLSARFADVTRRLRVTIEDIFLEGEVVRPGLEVRADIRPGNSGAPLFNRAGRVVGIIYASSGDREHIGFAVRSSAIAALLDRVGEPGSTADAGRCS